MQILDEKRAPIMLLLNVLRQFNPEIGNYEKSILNDNSQYAVKLSNGRLLIPQETVHDIEQSPEFVSEEQLNYAASTFIPSQVTNSYQQSAAKAIPKQESISSDPAFMYSTTPKQESSTLKRTLIQCGIVVLALAGYFVYGQIDKEQQTNQIEDEKSRVRNNITNYITAETNQYQYNEFGGIYNLVVSINNTSGYMMENVRVTLTYIKTNGAVWKNQDYDFEMLTPHSVGTIKVPNTTRGTSVKVRITAIKSTALGL